MAGIKIRSIYTARYADVRVTCVSDQIGDAVSRDHGLGSLLLGSDVAAGINTRNYFVYTHSNLSRLMGMQVTHIWLGRLCYTGNIYDMLYADLVGHDYEQRFQSETFLDRPH